MIIPGMEQNQIPRRRIILLPLAPQMALSSLNKANHIIFMKMIGKFLDNTAQIISLNIQIPIIIYMPLFLFLQHGRSPFVPPCPVHHPQFRFRACISTLPYAGRAVLYDLTPHRIWKKLPYNTTAPQHAGVFSEYSRRLQDIFFIL